MASAQSRTTYNLPHRGVGPVNKQRYEEFVSFCAIGGLITQDDGYIERMTQAQFADKIGVGLRTLHEWKQQVPDFAQQVRSRRDEVFSLARETRLFNELYTIALTAKDKRAAVDAAKTLLGHGGNLRLPTQRQEVSLNTGFAEMLQTVREEKTRLAPIEGEVVDGPIEAPTDA